jgi:cyanate permease
MAAMLLAHQGGWDEALFVLAPLAVIGALLLLANRRADARNRAAGEGDEPRPQS